MARRHWTLLLVPDDHSSVRQYRVQDDIVRLAVGAGIAVFLILALLSLGFFIKESHRLRAVQLEEENRLLASELTDLREGMATLRSTLDDLSQRDEHYRLLAGLAPIDDEVRQVGIGGPGTATLQSHDLWRVNAELGAASFAAAYDLNAMMRRARLLSASWREATRALEDEHDRLAHRPSIWPTVGYLSSGFTRRRWHPLLHRARPHEGVDITAPRGTPIVATARGRVVFVGRRGDYGLMAEIDHGGGIVTRYAHASRMLVRTGQVVERGEKIGEVGDSGLAVGPHLHYEVLVNGRPRNPMDYILERNLAP